MQGALTILAVLVAVGLLLFWLDRRKGKGLGHHHHHTAPFADKAADTAPQNPCCGLHAACEKIYGAAPADAPVYYDDEELDVLAGRDPADYTDAETEMVRDVLATLRPADAYGWARSLDMRRIQLPPHLRDELLLLIEEA